MPAPGDRLADRYVIAAFLGSGGTATVYRAHDERLDRDVAIKTLLPNLAGDPLVATPFEREARAMAAVGDPGLVAVYDVEPGDAAAGREPFVVMELCPGGSLADRMGLDRPMSPDDLIPILVAVANALDAIHRAGLVHRDVKPSNILFAAERVKLADFGLARSDDRAAGDVTEPGTAVGTLAYLAPERLRGEPGGPPVDIYALGTIAHLGLTGRLPRPAGSIQEVVAASVLRAPAVSAVAPALGRSFDDLVLASLAVDPSRRPDALAFGVGLVAALGRWTRSAVDRAGIAAGAGSAAAVPAMTALARANPALVDDGTTVTAASVDGTAAFEPASPVAVRPRPGAAPPPPPTDTRRRSAAPTWGSRAAAWLPAVALLAVVLMALVLLPRLLGATTPVTSAAPAGVAGPASVTPPVSPSPSGSIGPSATSSASAASPRPSVTPDPALVALNRVDAAIAGARGGRDGLKGKEANDLASLAERVRGEIAGASRLAALRDARTLDKRARDLARRLSRDRAAALTSATRDLVQALGG